MGKWGFKNFSTAVKSIDGVVLEAHLEKTLTNLPFFKESPAHVDYLAKKEAKEKEVAANKAAEEAAAKASATASAVHRRIRKKTTPPCNGYGIGWVPTKSVAA